MIVTAYTSKEGGVWLPVLWWVWRSELRRRRMGRFRLEVYGNPVVSYWDINPESYFGARHAQTVYSLRVFPFGRWDAIGGLDRWALWPGFKHLVHRFL